MPTVYNEQATNATSTNGATFPGWGSANAVQDVQAESHRNVTAAFDIAADTDSAAHIEAQVDTGNGMVTVGECRIPSGVITTAIRMTITFSVPHNADYQFIRTGNAGVSEVNTSYSYTDVG